MGRLNGNSKAVYEKLVELNTIVGCGGSPSGRLRVTKPRDAMGEKLNVV